MNPGQVLAEVGEATPSLLQSGWKVVSQDGRLVGWSHQWALRWDAQLRVFTRGGESRELRELTGGGRESIVITWEERYGPERPHPLRYELLRIKTPAGVAEAVFQGGRLVFREPGQQPHSIPVSTRDVLISEGFPSWQERRTLPLGTTLSRIEFEPHLRGDAELQSEKLDPRMYPIEEHLQSLSGLGVEPWPEDPQLVWSVAMAPLAGGYSGSPRRGVIWFDRHGVPVLTRSESVYRLRVPQRVAARVARELGLAEPPGPVDPGAGGEGARDPGELSHAPPMEEGDSGRGIAIAIACIGIALASLLILWRSGRMKRQQP